MKRYMLAAMAASLVTFAGVVPAEAQGRGHDRLPRVERGDDRDDRDDRDDDRYEDRDGRDGRTLEDILLGRTGDRDDRRDRDGRRARGNDRNGNGPPFCRNGQGHPVHGWSWCREKGWDRSGSRAVRWERGGWEDIILRQPKDRRYEDRGGLIDVLGDIVLGRLDQRARTLGAQGDLAGRWYQSDRSRTLLVTAGGVPLARLTDRDGDGRADAVLLAEW